MPNGGLAWASAVLVASGLLAGCSSTMSGRAEAGGGTAAGAAQSSAAPTTPKGPDAAAVRATVLQAGDLPAGWTNPSENGADSGDLQELESCLGAHDTSGERFVTGGSPAFINASGGVVFSSFAGFRSQRDVDEDTALLADPGAAACLKTSMEQGMDDSEDSSGTTMGDMTFTLTPGSGGGPSNVVAIGEGSIPVSGSGGRHGTVYLEAVFVTGRMTEAEIAFISPGSPVPDDLRSAAVTAVAQRLAAL